MTVLPSTAERSSESCPNLHAHRPLARALPTDRRWRIALYSHDTMGLGHKRRTLLIAQTLAASALNADILIISGMPEASHLSLPDNVDCLTLPALYKCTDGQYQSRRLDLPLEEIVGLRSRLIHAAIKGFQPDVLIVDNVPRGAVGELNPTLEYIHGRPQIRCVLGLRDVLDAPAAVQRDWQRANNEAAIRRYYDTIWVYGDPSIYDLRRAYGFAADITAKIRPIGYLDQRLRLSHIQQSDRDRLEALLPAHDKFVLCLVGGGQDGAALAAAFAQATLPEAMQGIVLTGPFMPPEQRRQLEQWATHNPHLHLLDYCEEPTLLLERADRVIAMGGYNTTCEILSFQKPALLVPRVVPRQEQWIRARRLQALGLIDVLHPEAMTPAALTAWLHQAIAPTDRHPVNLNGLNNLLVELQRLLMTSPAATSQAS